MIQLTKSQPAPTCLALEKDKTNGTYNCGDVQSRLQRDSHNKCYICEEADISAIVIEHFVAHKGNKDLKFDWNNLLFACPHCNGTKGAKAIYDDILNCTNPAHRILDWIRFDAQSAPNSTVTVRCVNTNADTTTQNTVTLLNAVYNGNTLAQRLQSANIRKKLQKELHDFTIELWDFYGLGRSETDKEDSRRRIRQRLSPATPFTAFKVWMIRASPQLMNDFGDLLP
jgi:HNH endonuclease